MSSKFQSTRQPFGAFRATPFLAEALCAGPIQTDPPYTVLQEKLTHAYLKAVCGDSTFSRDHNFSVDWLHTANELNADNEALADRAIKAIEQALELKRPIAFSELLWAMMVIAQMISNIEHAPVLHER